jgi:hypothetical protein
MSKPVTNTAIEENNTAWLFGGNPRAIEAQEARGQRELESSTQLPSKGSDDPAWAKVGVVFGEPTPGDPLFRSVTLPAGWAKKATEHAMWLKLFDDKGRERARIFYKAAFYDRSAHIMITRRFSVQRVYGETYESGAPMQHEVTDAGKRVFATEATPVRREDWDAQEKEERLQVAACEGWLAPKFPNWKDPAAHWDDEPLAPTVKSPAK